MTARVRRLGAALCLAAHLAAGARGDVVVVRRGDAPPIAAPSVAVSVRGVEIRTPARGTAPASAEIVPWDMVRSIEGAPLPVDLELHAAPSIDLWRARTRIERGDLAFAEPLLRRHWERYRDADGPTAALVAEGLLRCALDRGDLAAALDPWFAMLVRRAGESRFPALPPVGDAETGLVPAFAPFVPAALRDPILAECRKVRGADASSPAVVERFERLIVASASDAVAAAPAVEKDADPAVKVLAALESIATAPDERARVRALGDFDRAFPEPPAFLALWRLAAAGASSARAARASKDPAALERAAIDLLAVPASRLDRGGLVDAYALEEAARLLRMAGDARGAARLEESMNERMRRAGIAPGDGGTNP